MAIENLTERLEGSIVVLEPLGEEHVDELWEAAQAPEIWAWLAHSNERERFDLWLELTFEAQRAGKEGPFATRDAPQRQGDRQQPLPQRPPRRPRGRDRLDLAQPARLAQRRQRRGEAADARHAFETLECVRVEFKTDARNERSRAALAAIPAQFEGILRNHMIVPDVGQRDSAYFSVIDSEWPAVEANLERRLDVSP